MSGPDRQDSGWFYQKKNIDLIVRSLVVICVAVVAADFFYHKHGHYSWEEIPGFHALYGFVSCVFLVLAATQLRKLIMRDEDYYD